ncbi:MAG: hypothetical protein P0S93_00835 [Candidatus Neptunochlamydia sp.]|nr:hypothetical protein [Candidatus Neptunochlamydia sp.]
MRLTSIFNFEKINNHFNVLTKYDAEKDISEKVLPIVIGVGVGLLITGVGGLSKRSMTLMGVSFTIGGISGKKGYLYTPPVLALLYFGYKALEKPVGDFYKRSFYILNTPAPLWGVFLTSGFGTEKQDDQSNKMDQSVDNAPESINSKTVSEDVDSLKNPSSFNKEYDQEHPSDKKKELDPQVNDIKKKSLQIGSHRPQSNLFEKELIYSNKQDKTPRKKSSFCSQQTKASLTPFSSDGKKSDRHRFHLNLFAKQLIYSNKQDKTPRTRSGFHSQRTKTSFRHPNPFAKHIDSIEKDTTPRHRNPFAKQLIEKDKTSRKLKRLFQETQSKLPKLRKEIKWEDHHPKRYSPAYSCTIPIPFLVNTGFFEFL